MDEVKIEIKDEFIHQDEELQTKKKSIASSSKENTNILNEELQIKNEPIDQGFILSLSDQENTLVKSETIEMKTDLKTEVKQENFGELPAREKVKIDLIVFSIACSPSSVLLMTKSGILVDSAMDS